MLRTNLSNQYQKNLNRGFTFISMGPIQTFQNETLAKIALKKGLGNTECPYYSGIPERKPFPLTSQNFAHTSHWHESCAGKKLT